MWLRMKHSNLLVHVNFTRDSAFFSPYLQKTKSSRRNDPTAQEGGVLVVAIRLDRFFPCRIGGQLFCRPKVIALASFIEDGDL